MNTLKSISYSSILFAVLLNSFALSIYLYTAIVEFVLNIPFSYESDWIYKYSPVIAVPLWLALSATSEDSAWKVLLLQIGVTLWLTSALIVLLGVKRFLYDSQFTTGSVITVITGLVLMFAFGKINEKLKIKQKNT